MRAMKVYTSVSAAHLDRLMSAAVSPFCHFDDSFVGSPLAFSVFVLVRLADGTTKPSGPGVYVRTATRCWSLLATALIHDAQALVADVRPTAGPSVGVSARPCLATERPSQAPRLYNETQSIGGGRARSTQPSPKVRPPVEEGTLRADDPLIRRLCKIVIGRPIGFALSVNAERSFFGAFTKAHRSFPCYRYREAGAWSVFHSTPKGPGRQPPHSGHRRWKMSEPVGAVSCTQVWHSADRPT